MKHSLFLSALILSFSAMASAATVSERVLSVVSEGTHMSPECAIVVTKTAKGVQVAVSDERNSLTFTSEGESEKEVLIKDSSTPGALDLIVRRKVSDRGDISVQLRRLQVAKGIVKVSQLKRGISGRANTLMAIQCEI